MPHQTFDKLLRLDRSNVTPKQAARAVTAQPPGHTDQDRDRLPKAVADMVDSAVAQALAPVIEEFSESLKQIGKRLEPSGRRGDAL